MLEQRRAHEKGYITLKEAATLTSYSSDYIGQLIRAGKIRGEQVYSNVAWVTTEDEVLAYMQDKNRAVADPVTTPFFAHNFFKYFMYGLIAFCGVFLLVMQYILYVSIDNGIAQSYLSTGTIVVEEVSS
jgi:hypothetical protein